MTVQSQLVQLFEWHALALTPSTARADIANDASIATDGVAVDGVVNRAIAHASFLHRAHDRFKCFQVLGRVAVQLNIADVAAVGHGVVGGFAANLFKRRNRIIYRHMERVCIVFAVGDARNHAVPCAVDAHEASGKTFRGGCNQREVEVILRGGLVHALAHVRDDAQAQFLGFVTLAVMDTDERFERLSQSDKAASQRTVLEHFAHAVIRVEFFRVNPNALTH